jgi:hypothetical protein
MLIAGGKISVSPNDLFNEYHKDDPASFSK